MALGAGRDAAEGHDFFLMSAYYELPSFRTGQTWKGVPAIDVQINGANPVNALASAELRFRKQPSETPGLVLTTESGGGLTITNAATWEIEIPEQSLALSPGTWSYVLVYTDAAGRVVDYLQGTIDVKEAV